jgi:8-oxo-dGTP diphosphatase
MRTDDDGQQDARVEGSQPASSPAGESEAAFLRAYDPRAFDPIAVTVDVVALTIRSHALHVLLIRRADHPFKGAWALPGGFVRPQRQGDRTWEEDLEDAAARELAEETGLLAGADGSGGPGTGKAALDSYGRVHLEQLGTYGTPGRDPRLRVVSVAYLAFAPELPDPLPGGDADAAAWVPVDELVLPDGAGRRASGRTTAAASPRKLAFDHARIVADGLERAAAKLEYTPLATAFIRPEFTIAELRSVYEAVWGERLHAGNFHRKVLSVPGFVESVGEITARGGPRGGPRARLYRAGDARLLHPALLRPSGEASVR